MSFPVQTTSKNTKNEWKYWIPFYDLLHRLGLSAGRKRNSLEVSWDVETELVCIFLNMVLILCGCQLWQYTHTQCIPLHGGGDCRVSERE